MKHWGFGFKEVRRRLDELLQTNSERNEYGLFTHQLGAHFNHAHAAAQLACIIEPSNTLETIKDHIYKNGQAITEMIRKPNNNTIKNYLQNLRHIDDAITLVQPVHHLPQKHPEIYFALQTGKHAHQLEWGVEPTTPMQGMLEHEMHRFWLNEQYESFTKKPEVPKLHTKESLVEKVIRPIICTHTNKRFEVTSEVQPVAGLDKGYVHVKLALEKERTQPVQIHTTPGVTIQQHPTHFDIKTIYDQRIGHYLVRGYTQEDVQ